MGPLARTGIGNFDPFPFGLLTMVVSLEAIILSVFVLLSQNRQVARDRVRNDIEYQVNLKAELEIGHLHEKVDHFHQEVMRRLSVHEKSSLPPTPTLSFGLMVTDHIATAQPSASSSHAQRARRIRPGTSPRAASSRAVPLTSEKESLNSNSLFVGRRGGPASMPKAPSSRCALTGQSPDRINFALCRVGE